MHPETSNSFHPDGRYPRERVAFHVGASWQRAGTAASLRAALWACLAPSRHVPVLVLLLSALLAACHKGPGSSELREDLQRELDQQFEQGLLSVEQLDYRGSYPYQGASDPRDRLLVYYSARLALNRDYRFSDWDEPNMGSLVSILGATPLGVHGVAPNGNKAGDLLTVNGARAFVDEAGTWQSTVFVSGEGAEEQEEPRSGSEEAAPYRQRMEDITRLGVQLQRLGNTDALNELEADLDRVLSTTRRRLFRSRGEIVIATGTSSGQYYSLGKALERLLTDSGTPALAVATRGSLENLGLVQDGEVQFAFSQNDIAYLAYQGSGTLGQGLPLEDLRGLCSLYPEAVQIVTYQGSGITRVADLRGKRVNLGPLGSGIRANALQVLEAAGLDLHQFALLGDLEPSRAAAQLQDRSVDAFFITSAYPFPLLLQLFGSDKMSLVSMDSDLMAELRERHPFFVSLKIPRGTYPHLEHDVATVGVTAMLVTHSQTPDATVDLLMQQLFGDVPALSSGSLPAYYISAHEAAEGVSIPLHPEAMRFLAQQ